MNRQEIADILGSAGLRPQHKFGQNFMIDQNILRAIADAGEIQPDDIVLEVGPGVGNLTRLLAEKAHRGAVIAVDIDDKLLPAAQRYHHALANINWINADVLAGKHELNPLVIAKLRELRKTHPHGHIKLVSNLPYNAASPLVAELLVFLAQESRTTNHEPRSTIRMSLLAFTVQYEVGQRMAAAQNTRDYGPLGILIQLLADVKITRKIPAGAFWPPPKIQSALVVVRPSLEKMRRVKDVLHLQQLLSGLFSHRRQTLLNAIKHHMGDRIPADLLDRLATSKIAPGLRPENLSLDQFLQLADALRN